MELSVGRGLGQKIGGQVGVGSGGNSEEDGSGGGTESLAADRFLHLGGDDDAGSAGLGLGTGLHLGTASTKEQENCLGRGDNIKI